MAEVDFVSYSVKDVLNRVANVVIYFPTGGTVANIQTFSDAVAAVLDAVTGAKIMGASMSKSLTIPAGLKADATAGEFIGAGVNYQWDAAGTFYTHSMRIPAAALNTLTGETLDLTDPAVTAFRDAILIGANTILPSDKYANDLTSLLGGKLTFRK